MPPDTTPATSYTAPNVQFWFGTPSRHADPHARVPAPIGEPCMSCGEPIAARDSGMVFPGLVTGDGAWHLHLVALHERCKPPPARTLATVGASGDVDRR